MRRNPPLSPTSCSATFGTKGSSLRLPTIHSGPNPGMVLLLRLLSVSKPIPELAEPAAGNVVVSLRDGATAWGARELLYVDTHPGWLEVSLICLETLVYAKAVRANPGLTVQDAIRKALAGVWGHCVRAVPRPLSSVPVRRTRRGQEHVLLRDVPTLPRHYLKLYLSLSGRRKLVTGTEWRSFMQRLSSERDLSSVGVLMRPVRTSRVSPKIMASDKLTAWLFMMKTRTGERTFSTGAVVEAAGELPVPDDDVFAGRGAGAKCTGTLSTRLAERSDYYAGASVCGRTLKQAPTRCPYADTHRRGRPTSRPYADVLRRDRQMRRPYADGD